MSSMSSAVPYLLPLTIGGIMLAGPTSPAGAQTRDVTIEVGGSTIRPPAEVEGETAQYLSAGVRAMAYGQGGTGIFASFLAGAALNDDAGGDYLSLTVDGEAWLPLGGGWAGGVEVRGFGFDVGEPFPYRALGVEGGPAIRYDSRAFTGKVQGVLGGGWSRSELVRYSDGPPTTVEDDLWRYGVIAEFLAGSPRIMAGLSAGVHDTPGGIYRSGGVRLLAGWNGPAVELRVDAWDTPLGAETTGGLAFVLPFGGWSLRGFLGKTEPDPLTLTEPSGGTGGVLLGRRLWGSDPLPPARPPLHRILEGDGGAPRVQIQVEAPREAKEVQLLGDFTLWEPLAMRKEGAAWVVELEIPEGTYHFGFLADGAWFLPEDAPDAVPDEWGRRNATLVIER